MRLPFANNLVMAPGADTQFEVVVGADNIVRINIDGICALRVRLKPGCQFVVIGPDREELSTMVMPT
jgi:hypothetical protein